MSSRMNGGSGTGLPKCVPSLFELVHTPVFLASKTSTELRPPAPLRFPTLWELAGAQTTAQERQKSDGLFQQLIGEPLLLFQSLLDDPERFEPGVSELLQDLINKRTELAALSHEEQELLNRAAIEFATAKRPQPKASTPKPVQRAMPAAARMATEQSEVEYREGGRTGKTIDVPKAAPTFWWRKKK
jgi:hypothetical protein